MFQVKKEGFSGKCLQDKYQKYNCTQQNWFVSGET